MSKITQYTTLSSVQKDDVLPIVDVHDTSMAASGTTKKVTLGNLQSVDWLNVVTQYGADPTGVADSTTAIQNAISAASAAGGGVVYLPGGTYLISQTLQAGSNTTLAGDGPGATSIKVKASSLASFTQVGANPGAVMICTAGNSAASKIRISDLTLDMNEAGNASVPGFATAAECSPLGIQNVTGLTVERVEVINAVGYSVFPWGCTDVQIRGCRILAGQASNGYSQQDGIHVTDCTAVRLDGNYIDTGTTAGVGDDAIAVQGVSTGCADVTITGNTIEHAAAHGITLALGGGVVSNVTIIGNAIRNTLNEGILLAYNTYVSSATYLITDVTITGNVLKTIATGGVGAGITLQDAFGGTGAHLGTPGYAAVTIAGNVLDGYTVSAGIGIYAQQGSDLTISDNTLRNWGAGRGITIGDNSSATARPVAGCSVSGNTIDMSTTAGTAPTGVIVIDSPDVIVTDNAITGPGTGVANGVGITLLGITTAPNGCVVCDNRLRAWQYGTFETNSGVQPDYIVYTGNNVHGCTNFITTSGTHDVVGNNVVA